MVSKHAIRIPPLPAGRRVRWTFEVSADLAGDKAARTTTTPKKRQRARRTVKKTPASDLQPETLIAPVAGPSSAPTTGTTAESGEANAKAAVPAPVRRAAGTSRSRTVALAGVAALVVAALAFPRRTSTPAADGAAVTAEPERAELPAAAPVPEPVQPTPTATVSPTAVSAVVVAPPTLSERSKKTPALKSEKARIAQPAKSLPPMVAETPAAETSPLGDAATTLPAAEAKAVPAPASTETVGPAPVTITGCLETGVNQDQLRLTDTGGVDAPRSRNWRTGFLKKRAAPVALVEPPDGLALQAHIGQRVAATGLLTTRELKVRSLRVVGPCS